MLELSNLTVGYKNHVVVEDIDLTFSAGEITTIIGKNGSGKSTLLKTASSLLAPISGQIYLEGRSIDGYSRREWAQKLSFLNQSHAPSNICVHSLVSHGRYPHLGFAKRESQEDIALVNKAIAVMGLEALEEKSLASISGGERQKAYLAMALAQDTQTIVFDEPGTYLDIAIQKEILAMMKTLASEGRCIIAVMHDISSALQVSDKICLLDRGTVVACAPPVELVRSKEIERVFGVECTPLELRGRPVYHFS